ncbi:MAG: HAMP domain-containing histidine kinase [Oceanospirillaceae bacterium]|jgi:signal transduction histidine kinase|nr:HAMP domain-containing histidine kinase [Oceanospirillaceae bacterium]MBT4444007.1 HAMP domain-containing histidine kinase [Oceanospirillaceae bacterium]MBT6076703.1 HAMP domain-containing histidine kinase [Oceanospirillaceae bacterium]MBT7329890.1 HAMP domain-containing histidine kinase [Oceanospirillaceae bacterium]
MNTQNDSSSALTPEVTQLKSDLKDANDIALMALRANGELGVVINFLEHSFSCADHVAVGQQVFKAMRAFGLSSSVQLRVESGAINICDQEFAGQEQEFQFLSRLREKGRIFDFGEHTLVNYNHISLLIRDMPLDQPDRHGRIKDNVVVLLNGAEARIKAIEAGAKADRIKSEFLANMSHELRTPMHAILSFSNIGHSRLHKVDLAKLGHYFERIKVGGNRLLLLLNDLLDLSKLESGKMKFIMQQNDLAALITRAVEEVETLITDRELQVVIEPTQMNTVTYFDEEKILQLLINLLSNAIKFTPVGKKISIFFDADISAQPKGQHLDKDLLTLVVDDQGLGIPPGEEASIFDKFMQSSKTNTGAGGTGLGLSIVQEIITAHNGYIAATGNPDGGARFRFSLPIISGDNVGSEADTENEVDIF